MLFDATFNVILNIISEIYYMFIIKFVVFIIIIYIFFVILCLLYYQTDKTCNIKVTQYYSMSCQVYFG